MAVEDATGNGNAVHMLKEDPVIGVSDEAVIGGGDEGAGNSKCDGVVLALAGEDDFAQQEASGGHIDDGGIDGGTSFGPCGQKGFGAVGLAIGISP